MLHLLNSGDNRRATFLGRLELALASTAWEGRPTTVAAWSFAIS